MKPQAICSLLIAMFAFALTGCAGGSGTTAASGPFTGTWSGNNPLSAGLSDTLTLSQSGTTVTGFDDTHSAQGVIRQSVSGTVSGNTATVAVTNNGASVIAVATLTFSGTSVSMQWTAGARGMVTELLIAGATPPTLTAEAFCATLPSIGYGNFFYCGTNQGNLQLVNFPDGAHGFCQSAFGDQLGLVGYVFYTYSGGIGYVESQSNASAHCNLLPGQCGGYITCTRQ